MSHSDFEKSSLGAQDCSQVELTSKKVFKSTPNLNIPPFKDWRDEGVVTPVKD
jgi:hypothetical protein